jgi:voltage-gated sodium channel
MSATMTAGGPGLPEQLARLTKARWFQRTILLAIALTGVLAGLETYPRFRGTDTASEAIAALQQLVLLVFVAEIVIRIGAYGARPWLFFTKPWNVFDFVIVALCLLPLHAEYVVVFRLLRTLRLFTALHGLQIMVSGLLRGIPSLGYVGLLLLLHFYIYAVVGTFVFGDNDPVRFGTLHNSMLTLFQVLTLEGWNDILATAYHGSDIGYDEGWKTLAGLDRQSVARPLAAAAYFVSFILIGTMIMLNLFTGVIIRSMEEAHVEAEDERRRLAGKAAAAAQAADDPHTQIAELSKQLSAISAQLAAIKLDGRAQP